jgi:ABC-type sugar transport system substrate-binding protein
MNSIKILVSLITDLNDFQRAQATAAQRAAQAAGVDVEIVYADGDALIQSQQLLKEIQRSSHKPNGTIVHPAGTALAQVARAAVTAGTGWGLLNRDADYIAELRRVAKVPVFSVTTEQVELGRLQGQQLAALLPNGGNVLYIQGPSNSPNCHKRTEGMIETKPANVQIRMLHSQWTQESATSAVAAWLRLSTSHDVKFDLVACHSDSIAMGARKAFEENTEGAERDKWMQTPFVGCDACEDTGQVWIRRGWLALDRATAYRRHRCRIHGEGTEWNFVPARANRAGAATHSDSGAIEAETSRRSHYPMIEEEIFGGGFGLPEYQMCNTQWSR